MVLAALATLVLMGVYPAGQDVVLRWIAAAASGIVVVAVLVTVVMLSYPDTKQAARQDPVDAMNTVIATRP